MPLANAGGRAGGGGGFWEKMIGPYFGQDTLLRVQLNVRNLLNEDDLIAVIANPDGTIPVIRIPAERRFELRGTLSY